MDAVKSLHFSDENLLQIKKLVQKSLSIRSVLSAMNISAYGGNYRIFKRFATKHSIDTSHFTGKGHNKNKRGYDVRGGKIRDLSELLLDKHIASFKLKNRLIRDGIFQLSCSSCDLTRWKEQTIPLELDHIDGDNSNNSLENLRLLCPNCHALTPTYRGKNKRRSRT